MIFRLRMPGISDAAGMVPYQGKLARLLLTSYKGPKRVAENDYMSKI